MVSLSKYLFSFQFVRVRVSSFAFSLIQSLPITTKVVSLNPAHGEVYSIQHYVIKFVSDMRQICMWFTPRNLVSSTNKTDLQNITEILLKVALNTISLTKPSNFI